MAIARLVPSELYNAAGTSYLSVQNEDNACDNTDSDTYATVTNVYASTTNRYVYLRGFNWDAIPSGAIINSFRILLKARETSGSTSSSYRPVLCKGTSTYSNAYCNAINTTATVHEFEFTQDFDTFRDDGEEFAMKLEAAGTKVHLIRMEGMMHGFALYWQRFSRAAGLLEDIGTISKFWL